MLNGEYFSSWMLHRDKHQYLRRKARRKAIDAVHCGSVCAALLQSVSDLMLLSLKTSSDEHLISYQQLSCCQLCWPADGISGLFSALAGSLPLTTFAQVSCRC
jgi:hypothetical protein